MMANEEENKRRKRRREEKRRKRKEGRRRRRKQTRCTRKPMELKNQTDNLKKLKYEIGKDNNSNNVM